jgi:hypothetical protein
LAIVVALVVVVAWYFPRIISYAAGKAVVGITGGAARGASDASKKAGILPGGPAVGKWTHEVPWEDKASSVVSMERGAGETNKLRMVAQFQQMALLSDGRLVKVGEGQCRLVGRDGCVIGDRFIPMETGFELQERVRKIPAGERIMREGRNDGPPPPGALEVYAGPSTVTSIGGGGGAKYRNSQNMGSKFGNNY